MLQELSIKNFAVIKELSLQFSDGMTVLTGETGAGKSIIIDAVQLLTGARGSASFVRHGEEKAQLQALFYPEQNKDKIQAFLEDLDIYFDEQSLVIQRDMFENGRQVSRVNGTIVTIGKLKELGSFLVDIQGQHSSQDLLDAKKHLSLLDHFADKDLDQAIMAYQDIYKKYQAKRSDLLAWQMNEQEVNQKLDILSFQIKEIQEANLKASEDEDLEKERAQLVNYQKVVEGLNQSYYLLSGDDKFSSLDQVGQVLNQLENIYELSESYQAIYALISTAFYQLEEAQNLISDQILDLEYDEDRLNEIESRLMLIQNLKRKYGQTLEGILEFQKQAEKEYNELSNREESVNRLEDEIKKLGQELYKLGFEISQKRRQVAKKLENQIHQELQDLYMDKVRFQVRFRYSLDELSLERADVRGLDQVSFFVSTNPGEPMKALEDIVSGGELSRLTLALKTIFSQKQGVSCHILDEVDTGVSGRVASAIAEKIYKLSQVGQVLCISHLPQVAAQADHHLYVSKEIFEGRTSTQVRYLNEEEKVEEIAQMLAGDGMSESSLQAARDLRLKKKDHNSPG